ncbi:Uncharacterized protein Rs2_41456 [Raphanus sativus]|nr:Uncharacterized protein Rs2_41456 [Raphanus sativus]
MSSGRLCGFTPITFCRKLTRLQVARGLALKKLIKGKHDFRRASTSKNNLEEKKSKKIKSTVSQTPSVAEASPKSFKSPKQATASGSAVSPLSVKQKPNTPNHNDFEGSSPKCTANFILMVELRKNIFSFRDMIDLPSLDGSLSVTEIITHTMKDLQKLSPEIVTINQSFDMEGAEMDKMLIFFYEDLRAIGDSWIMDSDWIYRSKYRNSGVGKNKSDRLVEHVLAALDGLIKMTKERFGMMDLDSDGRKSFKGVPSEARRSFRRSVSYSESNNSFFPSPITPRSVIPGTMMSSSSSTSPSLWNLRAQALDKLSPVDLKQLAMQTEHGSETEHVNETEHHIKGYETEHESEGEHHIESTGTEHVNEEEHHNEDNSPTTPAPPAPPGSGRTLRGKRTTSKLRRSAQIANLYWVLKGKLEGRGGVEGKTSKASKGQHSVPDKSPVKGARSGMADALAEMTKRSSYFQQIEEDVQKYAKSIEELKTSIQKFQTKDMKELLEFHSKVESVLEKLTDETQVLARFEGFPEKKLEAIRTAGAVYKKLDGILVELKNWKIEPPLNDLLDKIERYFNKFKGEIETVERTKDEEAKMFQRHNINIDFEVLVQVKETMVDVSSNCMELALKERREANEEANNNEESKMNHVKEERAKRLWRAFQFAFKVYTFAGGHDERADHLTRQLAHEIQTDPDQTDSSNLS